MTKVGFFSFPRAFYVINGIELLERGAYYTMNALLALYMATSLGLPAAQVGLLTSVLFLLLYTVPLFGAPYAEKLGYKIGLVTAFLFLAVGYASLLAARDFYTLLFSVSLIGFGAGVFKPIAAAAVSQTSSEEQRNYAFMIYYGAINFGATVFPLAIGLLPVFGLVPQESLALIAFPVAATLSALNFVLVLTVWRNIHEPRREKSILQSFGTLGSVFLYPRFLILLVIYSGFWFLYAMSLGFLTVYMEEFDRMPAWFNAGLMNAINPLVIVLVAPFLGSLTKPFQSVQLMIVGITLYVVGFVTIGFSASSILFVGGILIFSIGEVLTHPSFLAYVTKIAPPDKVSIFLGYGFLPIAIGLFFGASVGGVLYGRFAQDAGQPAVFWAIMAGVALVTVSALLIYNRFVSPPTKAVAPGPAEPKRRSGLGAVGTFGLAALALLAIPALFFVASALPGGQPVQAANTVDDGLDAGSLATIQMPELSGSAEEGTVTPFTIALPSNATGSAIFSLAWTDEAPATPAGVNAPDTFILHVTLPNGTMLQSEESSSGSIEFRVDGIQPGDYVVEVELVDAGDTAVASTPLGPLPVGGGPDDGNDFTLAIEHQASPA